MFTAMVWYVISIVMSKEIMERFVLETFSGLLAYSDKHEDAKLVCVCVQLCVYSCVRTVLCIHNNM